MMTRSAIFSAVLMLAVGGCAEVRTTPITLGNGDLTHGNVQLNLKVGQTTQADVLEVFGAPNITTIDGSGQEVWSYQRHATITRQSSASNYWTVALLGASSQASGFEENERTMTLIIRFGADKVVSDFRARNSEF